MTSSDQLSTGSCYCGAVSYKLTGSPILSAYCHCTNCQRLTGCPFVHTIHMKSADFTWTHDAPYEAQLDAYVIPSRPHKTRYRCKTCGATVTSQNSKANTNSVWGVHLERNADGMIKAWESVKPTHHIFYDTRILDIRDELPKWDGYEGRSTRMD